MPNKISGIMRVPMRERVRQQSMIFKFFPDILKMQAVKRSASGVTNGSSRTDVRDRIRSTLERNKLANAM